MANVLLPKLVRPGSLERATTMGSLSDIRWLHEGVSGRSWRHEFSRVRTECSANDDGQLCSSAAPESADTASLRVRRSVSLTEHDKTAHESRNYSIQRAASCCWITDTVIVRVESECQPNVMSKPQCL